MSLSDRESVANLSQTCRKGREMKASFSFSGGPKKKTIAGQRPTPVVVIAPHECVQDRFCVSLGKSSASKDYRRRKKTEAERQLFPLSPQAYELLREIGTLLKETHGSIPTIYPHPDNTKVEDLLSERYLFQWAATPDGREGALSPHDVRILLRFILHGLTFRTRQGESFVVSTHLLRHVMAFRGVENIPPKEPTEVPQIAS